MIKYIIVLSIIVSLTDVTFAHTTELDKCDMVWTNQSQNSLQSMPCGGCDIGLNVWVEHGEVLFYIDRSGTYDENNALLKLRRIRIYLSPDPFFTNNFKQTLDLNDGYVSIEALTLME